MKIIFLWRAGLIGLLSASEIFSLSSTAEVISQLIDYSNNTKLISNNFDILNSFVETSSDQADDLLCFFSFISGQIETFKDIVLSSEKLW